MVGVGEGDVCVAVLVSVKLQGHNSPLMEMLLGVGWLWNALCVCASHMKEWLLCTWFELVRSRLRMLCRGLVH